MTFEVETSPRFIRKAAKCLRKRPDLRSSFEVAIDRLRNDPFQPSLRLHPLHGDLSGFHAVSLTYQFRIVLVLKVEERRITPGQSHYDFGSGKAKLGPIPLDNA